MLESLTNPIAVTPFPSNSGRRVDAKNRKRISKSVDPCRIPMVYGLVQSRYSPSLRKVVMITPRHATVPKVQAVQSAESWLSRDNRSQVM
jgi:hypothetical protein